MCSNSFPKWGKVILTIDSQADMVEKRNERIISYVFLGLLFILLATVYAVNTGIGVSIFNFFSNLTLAPIPGTGISLPAPLVPTADVSLYTPIFEACLGIGFVEIVILSIRIFLRSSIKRKAETIGNVVFWFGASYLVVTYLVSMTLQTEWFVFWSAIAVVIGLSLVVRAIVLLANKFVNAHA